MKKGEGKEEKGWRQEGRVEVGRERGYFF